MMYEILKKEIVEYSQSIGIDDIGFASAHPFQELKTRLIEQQELGYASGFEKGTVEERTTPKLLMSEAESIIAIALSYPTRIKNKLPNKNGERRGRFATASWGTDYHLVLQ